MIFSHTKKFVKHVILELTINEPNKVGKSKVSLQIHPVEGGNTEIKWTALPTHGQKMSKKCKKSDIFGNKKKTLVCGCGVRRLVFLLNFRTKHGVIVKNLNSKM